MNEIRDAFILEIRARTNQLRGTIDHQKGEETRHSGRAQVDEVEDDLISFRDPGHRAGPGGLD